MAIETTYTHARANLKALLDEVTKNREQVVIRRREGDDVALIAADELRALLETAHLLRSPKNAPRLLQALQRAQCRRSRSTHGATISISTTKNDWWPQAEARYHY
jgi:antitoxin YefM